MCRITSIETKELRLTNMKKTLDARQPLKKNTLRVKVARPEEEKEKAFYTVEDEQGVNRVKSRKLLLIFSLCYIVALVVLLYKIL